MSGVSTQTLSKFIDILKFFFLQKLVLDLKLNCFSITNKFQKMSRERVLQKKSSQNLEENVCVGVA